jgi:hypothetical protein
MWRWTTSRKFSVKSVYKQLSKHEFEPSFKRIWKIKVFMWLVEQNAILTNDNLLKKKWQGTLDCYMCGEPKSVDHLFFSCLDAKVT